MRVEKTTAPPHAATVAFPLSTQATQPLPPASSTAPIIPALGSGFGANSPHAMPALSSPFSATTTPSHTVPSLHASTIPLASTTNQQKLSYDQLLANYQQVCSERDAFATQLEKLKEKSLALSIDTNTATISASTTAASLALAAASPSPRSLLASTFSPASPRSPASSTLPPAGLAASGSGNTLQSLRDKHSLIQSTIGTIQHKTARILHDQERELIRAFRLRLTTLTAELDAERQRSASGSAEWVSRCKRLSEEMEWLRGLVEELGEESRGLGKEVRRMRKAMRVQEEDREFLIRQLVQMKKENAKLRAALDRGAAGGGGGVQFGDNLLMLRASANDAVAAIKEWNEDEEKTAMS